MGKSLNEEPEILLDSTLKKQDKKALKKKIIIGISIVGAVGIISAALLYFLPDITAPEKESLGMYGSNNSYIYYNPDYELDVLSVPEYTDLDRNIYYRKGSETTILESGGSNTGDVNFFITYFDAAINGRYDEYNSFFTENYYKTNEKYTRFAPQMIYDILVEKIGEASESGKTYYNFNVSYKIYQNNGTFRNDIGSDGSKTLYFSLTQDSGSFKIDRITYYKS